MSKIWGKYPFTRRYDMRGLDGPSRHMVFDADGQFIAEFGGVHVHRETYEQDAAKNERSNQRAIAFCKWLNTTQKPKEKVKK